jgi:hypothetical protein
VCHVQLDELSQQAGNDQGLSPVRAGNRCFAVRQVSGDGSSTSRRRLRIAIHDKRLCFVPFSDRQYGWHIGPYVIRVHLQQQPAIIRMRGSMDWETERQRLEAEHRYEEAVMKLMIENQD